MEPDNTCSLCPRLASYRDAARMSVPQGFNAPVPSFGAQVARLLIVGLAPGLQGANRTGRPFTGDGAGVPLYHCLNKFGFSRGTYDARVDDGLMLIDCCLTNAVRCVPPQNKPTPLEIKTCNRFLAARLAEMPHLQVVLALGRIAHDGVLMALNLPRKAAVFRHGAHHALPVPQRIDKTLTLYDSYHCSRYNLNTGVLTVAMLEAVFANIKSALDSAALV